MLLSILICTIQDRHALLKRLLDTLKPQLVEGVEIITEMDQGEISIGHKRNNLLAKATGEYCCFIDDDDLVSPHYISSILEALVTRPDSVGFKLRVNKLQTNGSWISDEIVNLSLENKQITHLCPTKTPIARTVGYHDINKGEDMRYAMEVCHHIHSSVFIDEVLYEYLLIPPMLRLTDSKTHLERQRTALRELGLL